MRSIIRSIRLGRYFGTGRKCAPEPMTIIFRGGSRLTIYIQLESLPPALAPGDTCGVASPVSSEPSPVHGDQAGPTPETPKPGFMSPLVIGFHGPSTYWAEGTKGVEDRGVVVLENAVTTVRGGAWRAWGLVRHEGARDAGRIVVSARLLARDGTVLAEAAAGVLVDPLRPGEPAPFQVATKVGAEKVDRVEWSVHAGPPDPNASRMARIRVHWQVPFGVTEWKGVKRDLPYPHLLLADFDNLGPSLEDAMLIVAWVQKS